MSATSSNAPMPDISADPSNDGQNSATPINNIFHFDFPQCATGTSLFNFGGESPTTLFGARTGNSSCSATSGSGTVGTSAFASTASNTFSGNSTLSSPVVFDATPTDNLRKWERVEELLRKSLLGEELVNTQFHLFSAISSTSGRVVKPRVLCANNALLAKSSKYFLDLLSADVSSSDASLVDLVGDNDVPSNASIDEYGYDSDSDLDDGDDSIHPEALSRSGTPHLLSNVGANAQAKDDDESSCGDSNSVNSITSLVSSEQLEKDISLSGNKDGSGSGASSETAAQKAVYNKGLGTQSEVRLRSLGNRHILVKNTAFQTWYCLLNYLYMGKFSFRPLSSTIPDGQRGSSMNPLDAPKCSAKSMYRLASKVGVDRLRDEAFSYIRSNLGERNIVTELSCSILSKCPRLLEMELDVFCSHIASPAVAADFASLARRIAHDELPHGAEIIVGIYTRLVNDRHPSSLKLPTSTSLPNSGALGSVNADTVASGAPDARDRDKTKLSQDQGSTTSETLPSGSRNCDFTSSVPAHASPSTAMSPQKRLVREGNRRQSRRTSNNDNFPSWYRIE